MSTAPSPGWRESQKMGGSILPVHDGLASSNDCQTSTGVVDTNRPY